MHTHIHPRPDYVLLLDVDFIPSANLPSTLLTHAGPLLCGPEPEQGPPDQAAAYGSAPAGRPTDMTKFGAAAAVAGRTVVVVAALECG